MKKQEVYDKLFEAFLPLEMFDKADNRTTVIGLALIMEGFQQLLKGELDKEESGEKILCILLSLYAVLGFEIDDFKKVSNAVFVVKKEIEKCCK